MRRSAQLGPGWKPAAAFIAIGLAGMTGLAGSAGAGPEIGPFVASASASGARVGYVVPGFVVVEEFVDAGGPVAQTRLDTASADSYAALPHPGSTVLAYQGLAALAGVNSPVGYPFFVSATYPASPEQSLSDPSGAYQLKAKAQAEAAEALATAHGGGGDVAISSVRADASTIKADGKVTATAATLTEGLRIGDTLRIASVRSRSVTVRTAGEPEGKTETQLVIDGLRINDQPFGFGPGGFTVAGTPVPVPAAEVNKVANQALAPAGITMRFLQAAAVPGGAVAPVLEITAPHKLPFPGEPTGTLVVRLGGATSSVTNAEAAPLPGPATIGGAPLPAPTSEAPPPAPEPATAAAPAALGAADTAPATFVPSAAAGLPSATPFPADSTPAPTDTPAAAAPTAAAAALGAPRPPGVIVRATKVTGISAAYAAFLVAALAGLAGAFAWFRGGMKRWLAS